MIHQRFERAGCRTDMPAALAEAFLDEPAQLLGAARRVDYGA
jgi:hypothetical protein